MNPYDKLLEEAHGRPFACIVGWPVEHSRSPALHGFWLKRHHIAGHYDRLPVEPRRAALEELVAFLRRTPNARGCNLTLPHKIDISIEGQPNEEWTIERYKLNPSIKADDFVKPRP